MDEETRARHMSAGEAYGRAATCGNKIDYKSEKSAARAAEAMNAKSDKVLEAYPCFWCQGWHIGRAITEQEWEQLG